MYEHVNKFFIANFMIGKLFNIFSVCIYKRLKLKLIYQICQIQLWYFSGNEIIIFITKYFMNHARPSEYKQLIYMSKSMDSLSRLCAQNGTLIAAVNYFKKIVMQMLKVPWICSYIQLQKLLEICKKKTLKLCSDHEYFNINRDTQTLNAV